METWACIASTNSSKETRLERCSVCSAVVPESKQLSNTIQKICCTGYRMYRLYIYIYYTYDIRILNTVHENRKQINYDNWNVTNTHVIFTSFVRRHVGPVLPCRNTL